MKSQISGLFRTVGTLAMEYHSSFTDIKTGTSVCVRV